MSSIRAGGSTLLIHYLRQGGDLFRQSVTGSYPIMEEILKRPDVSERFLDELEADRERVERHGAGLIFVNMVVLRQVLEDQVHQNPTVLRRYLQHNFGFLSPPNWNIFKDSKLLLKKIMDSMVHSGSFMCLVIAMRHGMFNEKYYRDFRDGFYLNDNVVNYHNRQALSRQKKRGFFIILSMWQYGCNDHDKSSAHTLMIMWALRFNRGYLHKITSDATYIDNGWMPNGTGMNYFWRYYKIKNSCPAHMFIAHRGDYPCFKNPKKKDGDFLRILLMNWEPSLNHKNIGSLLARCENIVPQFQEVIDSMQAKAASEAVTDPNFEPILHQVMHYRNFFMVQDHQEKHRDPTLPTLLDFKSSGIGNRDIDAHGHTWASIAFRERSLNELHDAIMTGSDPIMGDPMGMGDFNEFSINSDGVKNFAHLRNIDAPCRMRHGFYRHHYHNDAELFCVSLWLIFGDYEAEGRYRHKDDTLVDWNPDGKYIKKDRGSREGINECISMYEKFLDPHRHRHRKVPLHKALNPRFLSVYLEGLIFHHYKQDGWILFLGLSVITMRSWSWLDRLLKRASQHQQKTGDGWYYEATLAFKEKVVPELERKHFVYS